jgi:CRISPR-associated protein Csb2
MTLWFSIEVRFLTGRYHGRNAYTQAEWPPTPLRLFQAITAGALSGRWAVENRDASEEALRWIESLGAPELILAAPAHTLEPYRIAVPNNQADRHVPALRKGAHLDRLLAGDKELKVVRPRIVGRAPLIYAWRIEEADRGAAEAARAVVRRLVVLGTGLDHAVADIRIGPDRPVADGNVSYQPGVSPCRGTLDSLIKLHHAQLERLKTGSLRENLPPVRYQRPPYAADMAAQLLFAIRAPSDENDASLPIDPRDTAILTQAIRVELAERLADAMRRHPHAAPHTSPQEIERLVVGRGADAADTAVRLQIAPLPSIGHEHSDGLLRRVLVSVPGNFPVPAESVRRALAGCEVEFGAPPSFLRVQLVPIEADDERERGMSSRYLGPARVWRSVSPVVLPGHRPPRRTMRDRTAPPGAEESQMRADARRHRDEAVLFEKSLKHAGLGNVAAFRLRREPFRPQQPRADAAWRLPASRHDPQRVWLAGRPRLHAEIVFEESQAGPILIGDGRFLGLGLFHAVRDETPGRPEAARYRLAPNGRPRIERTVFIADVLRRALMAGGYPPQEFSGHDADGPLRADPAHAHAFFLPEDADGDGLIDHLTVYCRYGFSDIARDRLHQLRQLWWRGGRGSAGSDEVDVSLEAIAPPEAIPGLVPLVAPSRIWRSATPYFMPRFRKRSDVALDRAILVRDQVRREWRLRFPDAPLPEVKLLDGADEANIGRKIDFARSERDRIAPDRRGSLVRLQFPAPVTGPIALGRSAHFGLGLFVAERSDRQR